MLYHLRTIQQPENNKFAAHLRKNQTHGEKILWQKIRAKRFHGLKFRRQVPIGPYIVDFLCVDRKMIIEVDGDSHFQPGAQEYDQRHDECIQKRGLNVLRISNRRVLENLDEVLTDRAMQLELYDES